MFYYLDKEKLKNNKVFVIVITDDSNEELRNKYFEYIGDNLPQYPIYKNNELREANDLEKISLGYIKLEDWQYIDGDTIKNKPPIPTGMVKPVWDSKNNAWKESATEEEITKKEFDDAVHFYNSELDFASKAFTELGCEIITTEQFEDVKLYMKAIDPFTVKKTLNANSQRPSIFDRYKKI